MNPWWRSTFCLASIGSLLLFAALPPLWWGWVGWIAPVPWLVVIRREKLGRRPLQQLYLAGVLFWLLAVHWLRLPHPATKWGWLAVAMYLGCYLPLFVSVCRKAVHRFHVPVWLAAPVAWTGLEWVRAHFLTGFLMGSLAHTQVHYTIMLQVADLAGEYAVDFLIMLVAACITEMVWRVITNQSSSGTISCWRAASPCAIAAAAIAAAAGYGWWRMQQDATTAGPRVALIQGNSLAEWKADPKRAQRIMKQYTSLSQQAVATARQQGEPVDLVVWPETMFRGSIMTFEKGYTPSDDRLDVDVDRAKRVGPLEIESLVSLLDTPVLLGVDVIHFLADPPLGRRDYLSWNSAVLADDDGRIVARYDKAHLVMFGEYIPLATYFPWLYQFAPLTGGATPGEGAVAMKLADTTYVPNICYESVLPHVIRRQVVQLTEQSHRPDVLVNLTNDAWYWGSSELDMHLACDVMRAIELRKPHLVAANGGISAHIDSCGRIVEQSPRQRPDLILADVRIDQRTSIYEHIGDWPAIICLASSLLVFVLASILDRASKGASNCPQTTQ